jgi:hypothetical protein
MQKWVAYCQTSEKIIYDNIAIGDSFDDAIAAARACAINFCARAVAWCARRADLPAPDPLKLDKARDAVIARSQASRRRAGLGSQGRIKPRIGDDSPGRYGRGFVFAKVRAGEYLLDG